MSCSLGPCALGRRSALEATRGRSLVVRYAARLASTRTSPSKVRAAAALRAGSSVPLDPGATASRTRKSQAARLWAGVHSLAESQKTSASRGGRLASAWRLAASMGPPGSAFGRGAGSGRILIMDLPSDMIWWYFVLGAGSTGSTILATT